LGLPLECAIVIPIHKTCAVGDGIGDVVSAVGIFALAGDENVVGLNFAAIGVQQLAA